MRKIDIVEDKMLMLDYLMINLLCAAAAAKLLQSCLTLCDPIEGSPPGSVMCTYY